jgi:hypothetical protein
MTSHRYEFTGADLARVAGLPLLVLIGFALLMHAGQAVGPGPLPILDVDRTILAHQADASRRRHAAEILLIGDSSCLMDVSATALQVELGRPVLNLATLSYVGMETHAKLIRSFREANPDQPETVVLLMHPESLRLARRNDYFSRIIENYLAGAGECHDRESRFACWSGASIFRERLLTRVAPLPLPGDFGQVHGFTWNLWDFMTEHQGSAIDPRDFTKAEGSAEYRLAAQLKAPSEAFRAALPAGVRLVVGITPAPASFVLPSHAAICERMLAEWAGWLRADATLALPSSLPDELFASATHLNHRGVETFTALLAEALR